MEVKLLPFLSMALAGYVWNFYIVILILALIACDAFFRSPEMYTVLTI
jgi:hypothetical protein